jgi:hypothetical protein
VVNGDFIECGLNTVGRGRKYIDFSKTDMAFWLFDTFDGIPDQMNVIPVRVASSVS